MQIKYLSIALTAFSFLLFTVNAYSFYEDEDNTQQFASEEYQPSQDRYAYSDYGDNYGQNYYDQGDNYYQRPVYREPRQARRSRGYGEGRGNYASRLPQTIATSEKTIVVDPRVHAWGAYADGKLIKAGLVTAGGRYCPDIKRGCKTRAGVFRIQSLGSASCKSTRYPLGRGGAPMPYCMFFNGNQGLHGSYQVVEGNVSHGCVRMNVGDASWVRFNFATVGTKVIVKPY